MFQLPLRRIRWKTGNVMIYVMWKPVFGLVECNRKWLLLVKKVLRCPFLATVHRKLIMSGKRSCQGEGRPGTQVTGTESYSITLLFPLTKREVAGNLQNSFTHIQSPKTLFWKAHNWSLRRSTAWTAGCRKTFERRHGDYMDVNGFLKLKGETPEEQGDMIGSKWRFCGASFPFHQHCHQHCCRGGFGTMQLWLSILVLLLIICVTWGKILNFICRKEMWLSSIAKTEIMNAKCLAHGKYWNVGPYYFQRTLSVNTKIPVRTLLGSLIKFSSQCISPLGLKIHPPQNLSY